MPGYHHLRNFQNHKIIPPSNICQYLGNFPDTQAFGKFPRYSGIWKISQIPRPLENFPDTQAFEKFPKFLQVFECGIFLRFWKYLKWLDIFKVSQKPRHLRLRNYPNVWVFEKFLKYLGIWGIPKCLGILEISKILKIYHANICRYSGNFPDTQAFGKFLFLTF